MRRATKVGDPSIRAALVKYYTDKPRRGPWGRDEWYQGNIDVLTSGEDCILTALELFSAFFHVGDKRCDQFTMKAVKARGDWTGISGQDEQWLLTAGDLLEPWKGD
jgi:hypothetical protein